LEIDVARIFEITDVPADRVEDVMQIVSDDGAVAVQKKPTGATFTVVAAFPDDSDETSSVSHGDFMQGRA
jgi:hypothetical protein